MSAPTRSSLDAPPRGSAALPVGQPEGTTLRALPLPLESYVCRNFLRHGICPYDTVPGPLGDGVSAGNLPAGALSATPLPTRRHCGCKFLHIQSAELKPTLTLLVQQGHGYVLGCKDFQCKPEKCTRDMCKFLHINSEEEATLLQQMAPDARELREGYLRQFSPAPERHLSTPTSDECRVPDATTIPILAATATSPPASEVVLKQPVTLPGIPTVAVGVDRQPREVCRQFLRGECHRGTTCRFLHPPVPTPVESVPSAAHVSAVERSLQQRQRHRETYEDAALAELQLELERILSAIH